MTVLPIAAVVAICLFIAKETVELFRRKAERRRKTTAIKELLQHEIADNYRVLQNLFSAIDMATRYEIEPDGSDAIVVQHGGRLRYHRLAPDGSEASGLPLPAVRTTEFNRLLPTVAELDKQLYSEIRNGYEHIYETEHLWTSFVDYLTGDAADREQWFEGFCDYAGRRYEDINNGVRHLYKLLTCNELPTKGARRSGRSIENNPKLGVTDMPQQPKEHYRVVSFEHIDDSRCFHPLSAEIEDGGLTETPEAERQQQEAELRAELSKLFRAAGWEGDGDIECFFVPPCFCNRGDTNCATIFHVKQSNNGTSWLAIPRDFRFQMSEQFHSRSQS